MIGNFVYLDGAFVAKEDAKVSVFDHSFIYGDGVFEGLQAVSGGIFKLRQHIERLFKSARFLAIEMPMSVDSFMEAVIETARRNRLADGYLRPVVSRGVGPVGLRNMDELGPPTVVIIAQHEKLDDRRSSFESGISAHVTSIRRIPPECMDPRVKTCNYINNILAYIEAKHAGARTAIMLDTQGFVSEGYGNNLFAVKDNVLMTPPLGNILAGITRDTLLELSTTLGIRAVEPRMTVYDLLCADEVFESATMSELTPIVRIDGREVGSGKVGPMTQRLHRELRTLMESGRQSSRIMNE